MKRKKVSSRASPYACLLTQVGFEASPGLSGSENSVSAQTIKAHPILKLVQRVATCSPVPLFSFLQQGAIHRDTV
jgi:hypothetical protein